MNAEPNLSITGDEARIIMNALVTSESHAPTDSTIKLYLRLNEINIVQPHVPDNTPTLVVAEPEPPKRTRSRKRNDKVL